MEKILITIIIFLFSNVYLRAENNKEIDSLIRLAVSAQATEKAEIYNTICWKLRNFKPDQAIEFGTKALEYAKKTGQKEQIVKSYSFIGVCHRNLGNYTDAFDYYHFGLERALEYDIKDQVAYSYINLGNLYLYQEDYSKAEVNLKKALDVGEEIKDSTIMSYCYLNLGRVLLGKNQTIMAEEYLKRAVDIRRKTNQPINQIATVVKYLGDVATVNGDYEQALRYYLEADMDDSKLQDVDLKADIYEHISTLYFKKGNYDSALFYGNKSLAAAKHVGSKYRIKNAYDVIGQVFYELKDYKKASDNFKSELIYNDSVFNEQLTEKLFNIEYKAEQYKKQNEINLLTKEKNLQNIKIAALGIGVALILVIALLLLINNKKTKRTNHLLQTQKDEIEAKNVEISNNSKEIAAQRDKLERQNENLEKQRLTLIKQQKQITDSIAYAQRIQEALLPSNDSLKKYFSDSFVLYCPRDVVSGDFYWMYNDDTHFTLAVADCTGHGVPGAFMSMLGISALNEIVGRGNERRSEVVLEELRNMVKSQMHQNIQTFDTPRDGMDLALIIVDKQTNELEYSGANIPLIYIRGGEEFVLKPNRNPIGVYIKERPFTSQKLQLQKGDKIYMSSDGYASQFGGEQRMKLKLFGFRDMLLRYHHLPMAQQSDELKKAFYEWKGDSIQIDDILVVGMEV